MAEVGIKLTPQQKIARVREAYSAFERGDVNAVMDFLTDDCVWHGGGTTKYGGDRRGKKEILEQLSWIPQDFEEFKMDIHEVLASDDHAAVLITLRSQRKGQVYEDKQVHVSHLTDDGKTKELWIISDTEQFKKALES